MKSTLSLTFLIGTLLSAQLAAQTVQRNCAVTNSIVYATAASEDGSVLFIGGDFTMAGPPVSNLALMNFDSDQPSLDFPRPDGRVNAIEEDGSGGWFIAGEFERVDALSRTRIAYIDASGALTEWDPEVDGTVNCMERVGDTLFIGGDFTIVAGQIRQRLAAFRVSTGELLPWAPNADAHVASMTAVAGSLYITGWFTTVGGIARAGLAACAITTGAVLPWSPQFDALPNQLLATPDAVYVCGGFQQVDGEERRGLAAFDPVDGTLLPWNANITSPDPTVRAMAMSNGALYFIGPFTEVNGVWHPYCAAVDLNTGAVLPFNPQTYPSSLAWTIAVVDGTVLVSPSNTAAMIAYDATTGALVDWAPLSIGGVYAIAGQAGAFLVGGSFSSIGVQDRDRYAALDGATGAILEGFPTLDGNSTVQSLLVVGDTLFMGGSFSIFAGVWYQDLVAIHIPTRTVLEWGVPINNSVNDIAVDGGVVYIAGTFSEADGQPRAFGAALSKATGELLPWDPGSSHAITSLAAKDGIVYAGGAFSTIGGAARQHFAALDGVTALATSLDVPAEAILWDMELGGDTLYLGGNFTSLGGFVRSKLGAIDLTTGQVTAWAPQATGSSQISYNTSEVWGLAVRNGKVYIGGRFAVVGGQPRRAYAVVDAVSGAVIASPVSFGINAYCQSITALENLTLVGGGFDKVALEMRFHVFALASCELASFHADTDADGYGNPAVAVVQCATDPAPAGYVANANDCNDGDDQVWTGGPCEVNGVTGVWTSACVCDAATAVREVGGAIDIRVFPNPFTTEITIRTSLEGPLELSLFDVTGRVMHTAKLPSTTGVDHRLNVDLPAGSYIMQLRSAEGVRSLRLVRH